MATPEKTHPKEDVCAAKTGRGHTRRLEYANFLKKTDQITQAIGYRRSEEDRGLAYSFGGHYWRFWEKRYWHVPVPGPGAYSPEAPSARDPDPSYTFGSRHHDLDNMASPGPCYALPSPSTLRPGPKFSITSRHMPSRFAITVEEE